VRLTQGLRSKDHAGCARSASETCCRARDKLDFYQGFLAADCAFEIEPAILSLNRVLPPTCGQLHSGRGEVICCHRVGVIGADFLEVGTCTMHSNTDEASDG
jgi:hypothetical protein